MDGYGGVGYHAACLVLLDGSKSAAFVTGPPVPLNIDPWSASSPSTAGTSQISGIPELTSPPASADSQRAQLFRTAEGKVYRVKPESREEAIRAGWVPIGAE
jgi:hypothetical protein